MMDPVKRSRLCNIGLAVLALLLMCILPTVMSYAVMFVSMTVPAIFGGRFAAAGVLEFFMENMNVYSILCYVAFGAPILGWLYVMIENARRVRRMVQAAQQAYRPLQVGQMSGAQQAQAVSQPYSAQQAPSGQWPVSGQQTAQAPQSHAATQNAWQRLQYPPQPTYQPTYQAQCQQASSAQAWAAPQAQPQVPPASQIPFASPSDPLARERVLCIAPNLNWRGLGTVPILKSAFLAFAMNHFTTVVMVIIAILLPHVFEEYTDMVDGSGMTDYGVAWFIATIILPPIVEESGFRGLGLTYLERAGVPFAWANLIQAIFFGIFHMNLVQGIYAGILGLALGYLAHHYKSLVAPMVMHGVYNVWGTLGTDLENIVLRNVPDIVIIALGIALPIIALKLIMDEGKSGLAGTPTQSETPGGSMVGR